MPLHFMPFRLTDSGGNLYSLLWPKLKLTLTFMLHMDSKTRDLFCRMNRTMTHVSQFAELTGLELYKLGGKDAFSSQGEKDVFLTPAGKTVSHFHAPVHWRVCRRRRAGRQRRWVARGSSKWILCNETAVRFEILVPTGPTKCWWQLRGWWTAWEANKRMGFVSGSITGMSAVLQFLNSFLGPFIDIPPAPQRNSSSLTSCQAIAYDDLRVKCQ